MGGAPIPAPSTRVFFLRPRREREPPSRRRTSRQPVAGHRPASSVRLGRRARARAGPAARPMELVSERDAARREGRGAAGSGVLVWPARRWRWTVGSGGGAGGRRRSLAPADDHEQPDLAGELLDTLVVGHRAARPARSLISPHFQNPQISICGGPGALRPPQEFRPLVDQTVGGRRRRRRLDPSRGRRAGRARERRIATRAQRGLRAAARGASPRPRPDRTPGRHGAHSAPHGCAAPARDAAVTPRLDRGRSTTPLAPRRRSAAAAPPPARRGVPLAPAATRGPGCARPGRGARGGGGLP
jgi:hypothetical protein